MIFALLVSMCIVVLYYYVVCAVHSRTCNVQINQSQGFPIELELDLIIVG
jgi:hypothetical protein